MNQAYITPGSSISHEGSLYKVKSILDTRRLLAYRPFDDHIAVLLIANVTPIHNNDTKTPNIDLASEEAWAVANARYTLIRPILENRNDGALVKKIARENKVNVSTLYRWLERYDTTGLVSSLMAYERDGARAKQGFPRRSISLFKTLFRKNTLPRNESPYPKYTRL